MSEAERQRWDRVHTEGDEPPDTFRPSHFLDAWLPSLPEGGRALDVACGAGRNALRLAEAGYEVDAVDISGVGVDHGRSEADRRGIDVNWIVADLDAFVPERAAYDVVVVVRFRNHDLWPRLADALAPGGWVLVEHHVRTTAPVIGPPDSFRLERGELLEAFGGLRVVRFDEEVVGADPDRPSRTIALQRIVARNGDPGP